MLMYAELQQSCTFKYKHSVIQCILIYIVLFYAFKLQVKTTSSYTQTIIIYSHYIQLNSI